MGVCASILCFRFEKKEKRFALYKSHAFFFHFFFLLKKKKKKQVS